MSAPVYPQAKKSARHGRKKATTAPEKNRHGPFREIGQTGWFGGQGSDYGELPNYVTAYPVVPAKAGTQELQ